MTVFVDNNGCWLLIGTLVEILVWLGTDVWFLFDSLVSEALVLKGDVTIFKELSVELETDVNIEEVEFVIVTWVIVVFNILVVVTCMPPNDRQIYFPKVPIGVHFSFALHELEAHVSSKSNWLINWS